MRVANECVYIQPPFQNSLSDSARVQHAAAHD
jgi:hypothetical protein